MFSRNTLRTRTLELAGLLYDGYIYDSYSIAIMLQPYSLSGAVAAHSAKVVQAGGNTVDAAIARLLGIEADTVAIVTSVMQSVALEVMGALLWTVTLPQAVKKPKVQEVRVKHIVPYNPTPKPPKLLGWARAALIQHQGQPRDSPVKSVL